MIRILLAVSLLSIAAAGCVGEDDAETSSSEVASGVPAEARKLRSRVEQFCGACHAFPEPKSFPRSMWGKLVREGYGFYVQSQRSDLDVPIVDDVVAFYESQAPEYFDLPLPQQVPDSGPLTLGAVPFGGGQAWS